MDEYERRVKEERESYYRRPDSIDLGAEYAAKMMPDERPLTPEDESVIDRLLKGRIEGLIQEYGPLYQHGVVYIENVELIQRLDLTDCEFGVQVSADGRVWVCINGIAWLRFKPGPPIPPIPAELAERIDSYQPHGHSYE